MCGVEPFGRSVSARCQFGLFDGDGHGDMSGKGTGKRAGVWRPRLKEQKVERVVRDLSTALVVARFLLPRKFASEPDGSWRVRKEFVGVGIEDGGLWATLQAFNKVRKQVAVEGFRFLRHGANFDEGLFSTDARGMSEVLAEGVLRYRCKE